MEELEVPTESLQEQIHEKAHHLGHGGRGEPANTWFMGVALTSALFATLAAIASMLAGHHINEAMIEQIQASNHWAYYQSKSIKSSVLKSKVELLEALDRKTSPKDLEKAAEYQAEQTEIKAEAEEKEKSAQSHVHQHVIFARAVTLFQIGIAVAAISVLVRRKVFWYTSLALGVGGLSFLAQGLV